jgi:hypothetical protein
MNNLSDEQKKMLKNMGALGYQPDKISTIMKLDLLELKAQFDDKNSEVSKLYIEGADFAAYIIDLKLFEMAQSGDIKAMDKLEKRQKEMRSNSLNNNGESDWGDIGLGVFP